MFKLLRFELNRIINAPAFLGDIRYIRASKIGKGGYKQKNIKKVEELESKKERNQFFFHPSERAFVFVVCRQKAVKTTHRGRFFYTVINSPLMITRCATKQ